VARGTVVVMDLLLPLAFLAAGLLIGYLAATARSGRTRSELAAAVARSERLAEEAGELRERAARDHDVLRALAPVASSLERLGNQVSLLERERIEQYSALTSQLTTARESTEELRRTTTSLASALRSTSVRGQWGEMELQRLLEAAGMLRHVDFTTQETISDTSRPDVIVRLPGGRSLPIDAKVPFDAWLQASAIRGNDEASLARRRELEAAHARALRSHVDALARRAYHEQLGDAEVTVMFVPSEALLAAALDADPALLDHALRRGVAPVSPASLLALLRAVAAVWAHHEVSEQARELLQLGRTLYERLGVVASHMTQVGRSLKASVAAYNKAVASLESRLLVTARQFETLAADAPSVAEIDGDSAQVREFTAAALNPERLAG